MSDASERGAWALRSLMPWGEPRRRWHHRAMGCCQDHTRRACAACRTVRGQVALCHRPHGGEGAAFAAEIFVNRHGQSSIEGLRIPRPVPSLPAGSRRRSHSHLTHLSGDIGMSTPPLMCVVALLFVEDEIDVVKFSLVTPIQWRIFQHVGQSSWKCCLS